ncbi:MAG: DUF1638 domain-containing protein [Deferrisomatales bacterium]
MGTRVFIACAALEEDLRAALGDMGVQGTVVPLRAALHLDTRALSAELDRVLAQECADGAEVAVIYGRCTPDIDEICSSHGVRRLPVENCYHLYLGDRYERHLRQDPGTYFLTDFLADNFEELCIRGLGLDRHPKLKPLLFRHYRRAVFIDTCGTGVTAAAKRAAGYLGLPLTRSPAKLDPFADVLRHAVKDQNDPEGGSDTAGAILATGGLP